MFSSFNFEDPPPSEVPRKVQRKDRSVRYLRALSAKNQERTANEHSSVDVAVTQASLSVPRPGILRLPSSDPGEEDPQPSTSSIPHRPSKWATVREKSPQIIGGHAKEVTFQERHHKLDLNKSRSTSKNRRKSAQNGGAEDPGQKSFSDVVKTAMMLRTWISAMEHDERESEPDRDATTTNAEITAADDRSILPSPPIFQQRQTGFTQIKDILTDKCRKLYYFYVTENSTFFYYWTAIISIGILYNMFAMVIFIFDDVHFGYFNQWLYVNLFFDFCFLLDCLVGSRMTFVSEGNEVSQTDKMFKNYRQSRRCKLDLLCLAPADFYLFIDTKASLVRAIRLVKAYRLYEFIMLTQRRTDFPHFMKILFLTSSCAILFHWNACVYFLFSLYQGLTEDDPNAFGFSYYKVFDPRFSICDALYDQDCYYPEDTEVLDIRDERPHYMEDMYKFWDKKFNILQIGNFSREYSMTIYWSSLTITKCGQQPWPSKSSQNSLEIFDTLIGVLVFATIIGGVGSVVTQMSQNVNDFREMMDGIKFYMKYRGVQSAIQDRVLNCFLYLNSHNQLYDEEEILSLLPPFFQARIAANLHQDTLSKVSLFYKCDQRLLQEVVMLVKQQVYSPNDYLCRKNEKAKEMFIVKKGLLAVIDDDTGVELDSLKEGHTFGELSIVQVKGNILGDRRSVSLRSVGYSDVYVLHQDDVTRLLQEYPEERVRLMENARRMLHSRGLLETNELGEMCETDDGLDDEAMLEFLSVDEQLNRLENIIDSIDTDLANMITSFSYNSVAYKKRVTALENIFNSNKKRIRGDLYNGILKTDYDDRMMF
ncbi:Cyclic nucleotide-binding domain-containing protein [Caenorhabditis elegans]|uniref:Cyclic nucleotide-binding domain-containing protein n=2 Tax=Caenorhabditis elegans TaxID=6239 RepID=Q9N4C1_CAEEL|nr:Cyclic nucleotide-binding domain-containing protein [Caenorhabditis elegans]CCD73178.2 Cyclic nucleotide-binding domain-containing protein [Caenorhabditis elegans]|eukprot:NP_001343690.1 Cyclic Nucleotide Gated channel [Caenorhabditis elegans]